MYIHTTRDRCRKLLPSKRMDVICSEREWESEFLSFVAAGVVVTFEVVSEVALAMLRKKKFLKRTGEKRVIKIKVQGNFCRKWNNFSLDQYYCFWKSKFDYMGQITMQNV